MKSIFGIRAMETKPSRGDLSVIYRVIKSMRILLCIFKEFRLCDRSVLLYSGSHAPLRIRAKSRIRVFLVFLRPNL